MVKILKNFNLFVDGRGYAGRAEEVSPPKLSIKTEMPPFLLIWVWKNWKPVSP